MTHEIFISHASADKEIADAMTVALEDGGIKCWIAPRDIRPGDTWGGSIVRAIESSKMMVIIFSESSNASRQVLREVERAVQKDVVLMPFRIDEDPPSGDMEYFLSATHWLDALTPNLDGHLRKLVRISNSILKKPTPPAAASADSAGANVKKAEPSIGTSSALPKSLHPTSSAVVGNANSNASSKAEGAVTSNKAEVAETTNKAIDQETTHPGHSTELKLEARRTPPGTKAKHSQTAKPSKAKVDSSKQNTSAASAKVKRFSGKKNTSKNLIIVPVLVVVAAVGWLLTQKTDLFGDKQSEAPVVMETSASTEEPVAFETPTSTEATASKEIPMDPVEPLAISESGSGDQNTQATPESETETEIAKAEVESAKGGLADDASTGQTSTTQAQDKTLDNSSDDSESDLANEPTPAAVVAKPKPKIDEIPPLVALANAGDIDAILELSERYLNGRGVNQDQLESVRLLEIAANNGSTLAQNKLANYYANGKIVPRNDEQALIWYTLAAEQGDINSQYSLGEIYEFGFGAEANLLEAKKWYGLAADQGHAKAALFLKKFQQKGEAESGAESGAESELAPPLQATDPSQTSAPEIDSDPATEPTTEPTTEP